MKPATTRGTGFYEASATEVYAENFDFTIIESCEPQPKVVTTLRSAISRTLATIAVAAMATVLTIPPGGVMPSAVSVSSSGFQDTQRPPGVVTMTGLMRERATLADQVFRITPHPGADDPEPDYDF